MVHTLPPWTTKYRMAKIFGQVDTGELAARLGSINTFDRRGNVVWYDDFESTKLLWAYTAHELGGAVALDTARARNGSKSVKITSGNATNKRSEIARTFCFPSSSCLGFEFHLHTLTEKEKVMLVIYGNTGSYIFTADLTINLATKTVTTDTDNSGTVTHLTDLPVDTDHIQWIPFKLVFDWDTKYFKRVIIADTEYDLSAYTINSQSLVDTAVLDVSFWVYPTDAANRWVWIDDFIFTQNEP